MRNTQAGLVTPKLCSAALNVWPCPVISHMLQINEGAVANGCAAVRATGDEDNNEEQPGRLIARPISAESICFAGV